MSQELGNLQADFVNSKESDEGEGFSTKLGSESLDSSSRGKNLDVLGEEEEEENSIGQETPENAAGKENSIAFNTKAGQDLLSKPAATDKKGIFSISDREDEEESKKSLEHTIDSSTGETSFDAVEVLEISEQEIAVEDDGLVEVDHVHHNLEVVDERSEYEEEEEVIAEVERKKIFTISDGEDEDEGEEPIKETRNNCPVESSYTIPKDELEISDHQLLEKSKKDIKQILRGKSAVDSYNKGASAEILDISGHQQSDETKKPAQYKGNSIPAMTSYDKGTSEVILATSTDETISSRKPQAPQPPLRIKRQAIVDKDDVLSEPDAPSSSQDEDNISISSKKVVTIPEEDRKVMTEFDDSDDDVADLSAKLKSLETEGFTEKTKVPKADLKIGGIKESPFSSLPQEEARKYIRSASSDAPPLRKNFSSPNIIKTPDTPGVHVSEKPFSYISGEDFQKIDPAHRVREAVIGRESMNNESVEEMTRYSVDSPTMIFPLATSSNQTANSSSNLANSTVTTQPTSRNYTTTRTYTSNVPEKKKFRWKDCFNCK